MSTIKPGCFGYVATFGDNEVCRQCESAQDCQSVASIALAAMQERQLEVSKLVAQHRAFRARNPERPETASVELMVTAKRAPVIAELDVDQAQQVEKLPVKAGAELRKIYERGILFLQDLQAGLNPIERAGGKPAYLAHACQLLLAGGFDRVSLRDAYIERFGWEHRTACSHVSIVTSLFPALGIHEQEGRFTL